MESLPPEIVEEACLERRLFFQVKRHVVLWNDGSKVDNVPRKVAEEIDVLESRSAKWNSLGFTGH